MSNYNSLVAIAREVIALVPNEDLAKVIEISPETVIIQTWESLEQPKQLEILRSCNNFIFDDRYTTAQRKALELQLKENGPSPLALSSKEFVSLFVFCRSRDCGIDTPIWLREFDVELQDIIKRLAEIKSIPFSYVQRAVAELDVSQPTLSTHKTNMAIDSNANNPQEAQAHEPQSHDLNNSVEEANEDSTPPPILKHKKNVDITEAIMNYPTNSRIQKFLRGDLRDLPEYVIRFFEKAIESVEVISRGRRKYFYINPEDRVGALRILLIWGEHYKEINNLPWKKQKAFFAKKAGIQENTARTYMSMLRG